MQSATRPSSVPIHRNNTALGTLTLTGLATKIASPDQHRDTCSKSVEQRSASKSKKQTCVALFTAEAAYMALASAAQEAIWLKHLVGDLGNKPVDQH